VAGNHVDQEDLKLKLLTKALRSGVAVRLKAYGTSMLPTLWPGDVLGIQRCIPSEIASGDIVLVAGDGRFLIHRIVDILTGRGCLRLVLRGDAMPHNDSPVHVSLLLGKVFWVERGSSRLVPVRTIPTASRIFGKALCHFDSIRSLALRVYSTQMQKPR